MSLLWDWYPLCDAGKGECPMGNKKPACREQSASQQTGMSRNTIEDDREWGGCAEASARRLKTTGYHPVGKYSNNPLDHLLSQSCLTISIRVPTRED
tara:strand:- start:2298 stop:2588 length:291 start_codon:yes stop_codon:yes gene_type:complete